MPTKDKNEEIAATSAEALCHAGMADEGLKVLLAMVQNQETMHVAASSLEEMGHIADPIEPQLMAMKGKMPIRSILINPRQGALRGVLRKEIVDGRHGAVPDVLPEVLRLRGRRDRGFAAAAAVIVTPAAIGCSATARRPRRPPAVRRMPAAEPVPKPVEQMFWYRSTKAVMRRAVPIGLAVVVLLLALGAPFLGVKWGFPDDRVLPTSASAHQVGDQLRNDFVDDSSTAVTVVVPDVDGLAPERLERYAADLSRVADVSAVSAPTGTFVGGNQVGPPSAATGSADGSAFFTVGSSAPLFSDSSETQLDRLHAVPGPTAGRCSWPASRRSTATASTRSPPGCRWCSA